MLELTEWIVKNILNFPKLKNLGSLWRDKINKILSNFQF